MKRKMSNSEKVRRSNGQHCRLYAVHEKLSYVNVSNDKKCMDSTIKLNYHKQVCDRQQKIGRLLTRRERKRIFLSVKGYLESML